MIYNQMMNMLSEVFLFLFCFVLSEGLIYVRSFSNLMLYVKDLNSRQIFRLLKSFSFSCLVQT